MKVTMKYDQGVKREEVVSLEVSEKELEKMVEIDYQQRLTKAASDETVLKRTPQEIIDECNRKEFNSWRTHNRRQSFCKQENEEEFETDIMDAIADYSQEEEYQKQFDYEDICQKIRQLLKTEHADMIIAICLDGMAIKDYALKIGDKPKNVYERFDYVKKALGKQFL